MSSVCHYNYIKFMRIKMIDCILWGHKIQIIKNKTVNSAFYASWRLIYFAHILSVFYLVHCIFDAYHH